MKITHVKQDLTSVKSKCGTMDNVKHTPRGGEKKVGYQYKGVVAMKKKTDCTNLCK